MTTAALLNKTYPSWLQISFINPSPMLYERIACTAGHHDK